MKRYLSFLTSPVRYLGPWSHVSVRLLPPSGHEVSVHRSRSPPPPAPAELLASTVAGPHYCKLDKHRRAKYTSVIQVSPSVSTLYPDSLFQSSTSLLLVDVGTERRDFGLVLWADHDLLRRESETEAISLTKVVSLELQMNEVNFVCIGCQLPRSL